MPDGATLLPVNSHIFLKKFPCLMFVSPVTFVNAAPLTLCRLSECLEALEKRLESSKLQLVRADPLIDIGIYLYC